MDSESRFEQVRDALLSHDDFLRALARSLLHDQHSADDAVQEVWLAALVHPPSSLGSMRGWISRVMRNRVVQGLRGRMRREQREQSSAQREPPATPAEDLEREQVRRLVADAVRALDEPYQTALFLRFYENREPREIAAMLGVPVETVRTRLKRGLGTLRLRIVREYGENRSWIAALGEMLRPPRGPGPPRSSLRVTIRS
jgi:RNA polymerase sigma-70 factor (ECF subfamily)